MKITEIVKKVLGIITVILAIPYAIATLILRCWFAAIELGCGDKRAARDQISGWASDCADLLRAVL